MQVPSARQLVLACCCSLVAAAPAHAAGWGDAGRVSDAPTGGDSQPVIAVEPDGDAVALWLQDNGSGSDAWANTRPARGAWGEPVKLTPSEDRDAFDPDIAMDAEGNAILTWVRHYSSTGDQQIQYATKPADGALSGAQVLPGSGASGADGGAPTILFDADGDATAVFDYDPGIGQEGRIRAVTRSAAGTWGTPDDLTTGATLAYGSQAGIDADGDITVVWREGYMDDPQQVLSKTRPAGGDWPAAAEDLGEPATTNGGMPELVVRPDGVAVAAWTQFDASDVRLALTAVRDAAGDWTTTDATPDEGELDLPVLDVGADGVVTFAARHLVDGAGPFDPSTATIVAARMPVTGTTFGDLEALSDGEHTVYDPALDSGADGTVTVAWRDRDTALGGLEAVKAARFVNGAWTFGQIAGVVDDERGHFGELRVAHDQHDNVLIATTEGSDERAATSRVLVYDQIAPTLDAVTVPAAAIGGRAVTMTAQATDDWLPVLPHWGFGDVFKAGFSVEQAFTAGTHEVHVGAVDLVGNTSEIATRSITVTDPVTSNPGTGGGGGTAQQNPAPGPAPQQQHQQPAVPINPLAALVAQLLGGGQGTQLSDVKLAGALVYGTGDVPKGRVTFGSTTVPLLAFIAQRDMTLTANMTLQGVPAKAKKASAAAARTVKLKSQKLTLKAGQGGVVKAKLTKAQRALVKRGKGKVKLVVTITAKSGGTTTKAKKTLRVSAR